METTSGRLIDIEPGTSVYGSDGEKLGAIMEIGPDFIVVEKGLFFPTDYFVPTGAIASVEPDRITLTLTRDEALEQGWDKDPTEHTDEPTASTDSSPDQYSGDFDGAAVSGFGPADDSGQANTFPPGLATELGTTSPAADFATLGVAPIDVNSAYADPDAESLDRSGATPDEEPTDAQRRDQDQS